MNRILVHFDSIAAIKRAIYVAALPVVAVLALVTWLAERNLGIMPVSNVVGLPLVAAFSLAMMLALLFWPRSIRSFEIGLVVLGALYLLVTLVVGSSEGYHSDQESVAVLARLGYWFPPYYLLVFLAFGTRWGLVLASVIFGLSVLLGASHFFRPAGHLPDELLLLSQMYVSNVLVILLLTVLSNIVRMQTRYAVEMELEANTDSLTGLSNRRHLEAQIHEEMARAARYQRGFSLILFDLDHFKKVNDSHGHERGDQVLRGLRVLFTVHIRQVDLLGRWGGEEFMILAPEMTQIQAQALAERLREVVENHDFDGVGRLTASFGVTAYRNGDDLAALIQRADKALYAAKQQGRNLVVPGD